MLCFCFVNDRFTECSLGGGHKSICDKCPSVFFERRPSQRQQQFLSLWVIDEVHF